MANSTDRQITLDGYKNAIVKWTMVADTSDIVLKPALQLSDLRGNDPALTLVGLRLIYAEWAMGNGIEVVTSWDSASPQQLLPLAGRGRIAASNYGGFAPDTLRSGYTGAIDISTNGYTGGQTQVITLVFEFNKMYK